MTSDQDQLLRGLTNLLIVLAKKLDAVQVRTTTANAAGVVVAITGTVLSLTGAVLAGVTLGASLTLTAVGSSMAASGGIAVTASHIANTVSCRRLLREAERKWTRVKQQLLLHPGTTARETTLPSPLDEKARVEKSEKILPLVTGSSVLQYFSIKDLVREGATRHSKSGEPAGVAVRELVEALAVLVNKDPSAERETVFVK